MPKKTSAAISTAFASDMMSDVLACVTEDTLLLTGLVNSQSVRTCEMLDVPCVVFVRDKEPLSDALGLAREIDSLQAEFDEGPCLDALRQQQTVRVPDFATETRWPRFAAEASRRGGARSLRPTGPRWSLRGGGRGAIALGWTLTCRW